MELRQFDLAASARDRNSLRALLEAMESYDHARVLRSTVVHLAALLGVVVWVCAAWPTAVSADVRRLSLALFGSLIGLAVVLAAAEAWLYRRQQRLIRRSGGTRPLD